MPRPIFPLLFDAHPLGTTIIGGHKRALGMLLPPPSVQFEVSIYKNVTMEAAQTVMIMMTTTPVDNSSLHRFILTFAADVFTTIHSTILFIHN